MKHFKFVFTGILLCAIVILSVSCAEKACQHTYIETAVAASCTEEGYNLFTCDQCGDSYKGDKIVPKANHIGRDNCINCGEDLVELWKNFILESGSSSINNSFELEDIEFAYSFGIVDAYDCIMSMNRSVNLSSDIRVVHTLLLAYNAYDGNWTWNYIYTAFLNGNEKGSKEAHGKFEKWSSHSNTLPCSYSNLNSNHLDEIKLLYDAIVNTINATLAEKGYNFTLENFGLEQ